MSARAIVTCPGCGDPLPDTSACYCLRCGCRLGRLVDPDRNPRCPLADGIGRFQITLQNRGVGSAQVAVEHEFRGLLVSCDTGAAPAVATDGWSGYLIGPGTEERLDFTVPEAEIAGRSQFRVDLLIWDEDGAHGAYGRGYEPPPPRRVTLWPRVDVLSPGRLDLPPELLVFPRRYQKARIMLRNLGQQPLPVILGPLPAGFQFTTETEAIGGPSAPLEGLSADERTLTLTLPGEGERWVSLLAPPLSQPWKADEARLRIQPGDGKPHAVALHREPIFPGFSEEYAYILGIDFGTAESRVYASPALRSAEKREPEEVVRLDSTMTFSRDDPDQFTIGRPRNLMKDYLPDWGVSGMKMLLREGRPRSLAGRSRSPHELVTQFLRHLRGLIADSNKLDQPNALELSHSCVTVPAMDTPDDRKRQAEETRGAAIAAGFLAPALSIHLEPECAGLDFIHRRGRKGFEGFDPRYGDLICIFDCGAGTTDISILRYLIGDGAETAEGAGDEVRLEVLGTAGVRFGGDLIDRLLAAAIVSKLEEGNRLRGDPPAATSGNIIESDDKTINSKFTIEGDPTERNTANMPDEVRPAKEEFYEKIRSEKTREARARAVRERVMVWPPKAGPSDPARVELSNREIDGCLAPWLEMVLETGIHPLMHEKVGTPLRELLEQAGLRRSQMRWCCMTGGSSLAVPIETAVARFFSPEAGGSQQFRLIVPPVDDIRLSVVRGAAMRHQYRIEGGLPCAITATVTPLLSGYEHLKRTREALPAGAPDGTEGQTLSVGFDFGFDVSVSVGVDYGGRIKGEIYHRTIYLEGGEPQRITVHVAYRQGRVFLTVTAGPETEQQPVVKPDLPILVV